MFRGSGGGEVLTCPDLECGGEINIFDVRALISEEEFQRLCDLKIGKFLERHGQEYLACKYC